jgi:hypothetical protein
MNNVWAPEVKKDNQSQNGNRSAKNKEADS